MPQLVTVRVTRPHRRTVRVWVPVLLVVLVLSPLIVLAVLAGVVACLVYGISATRALAALWRIVCALPGSRFDLEQDRTAVLVSIR